MTDEDEDNEDYYRDELNLLIEAYDTVEHVIECIRMECNAGNNGKADQALLSDKRIRNLRE